MISLEKMLLYIEFNRRKMLFLYSAIIHFFFLSACKFADGVHELFSVTVILCSHRHRSRTAFPAFVMGSFMHISTRALSAKLYTRQSLLSGNIGPQSTQHIES